VGRLLLGFTRLGDGVENLEGVGVLYSGLHDVWVREG